MSGKQFTERSICGKWFGSPFKLWTRTAQELIPQSHEVFVRKLHGKIQPRPSRRGNPQSIDKAELGGTKANFVTDNPSSTHARQTVRLAEVNEFMVGEPWRHRKTMDARRRLVRTPSGRSHSKMGT